MFPTSLHKSIYAEPWFPSRRTFVYDGRCMGFGVRVRRAEDDHRDHDLWMWPMLEEMGIILDCSDATACEVEEVEAVHRHAVDIHPNNPTLRLTRVNEDKMIASEQDEAVSAATLNHNFGFRPYLSMVSVSPFPISINPFKH